MTSILRKGSSSDYITIKKQLSISKTESKNQGANTTKTKFVTMMGNYHFIDTSGKCLQNSANYNLLYSFRRGQQNCCDLSNNLPLL